MADFFAVRNVDDKTKSFILDYAKENNLTIGDALREITRLASERLKEKKHEKKTQSIFDVYDKIKFSSNTGLSV
ncbi:Uncharacterised protein [Candidatus Bilamarchaeum dharawalense]|uniref:Uncharacterized protein n=1 Tax=Candidatus Bilamarchaeum dharawalense TaxID=2885759 RepID=A0A5E4LR29_9ARCH|nr:Uncharacterised protein [Candidatus Bilamarchaeum dharawalense]